MISYRFHIIGAGRLGKTLGRLLSQHTSHTLLGVVNQTSAQAACNFIGVGKAYAHIADLPTADLILLTCPDDQITSLSQVIAHNKQLKNAMLIHCSGSLSSKAMCCNKQQNHLTGSIHPLKSFADPALAVTTFAGTYCTFEGDPALHPIMSTLITDIGGIALPISTAQKSLYHAGSVMLSNFMVALYELGETTLKQAGIAPQHAHDIARQMMQNTVENCTSLSPQAALTGPALRGDLNTIQSHLNALPSDSRAIYLTLTQFIAQNMQPDLEKHTALLALLKNKTKD